eukprot:TRINITY_DN22070_c0_g1_i2.p1 TRINITY_DN22070_c0_g1~~TRINITY_DN22070_c0_g1_i2.p1  ORF type:complete len:255 (+),score=2.49 TRINITY_DN22070_c0_g1_i2:36-800(+)
MVVWVWLLVSCCTALGYEFFDEQKNLIERPVGQDLIRLASIRNDRVLPQIQNLKFLVACDVSNPLLGKQGATAVYGPQKGATTAERQQVLERGLNNLASLWASCLGVYDIATLPGSGAAGGLGGGLRAFCPRSQLVPGFSLVARYVQLEKHLENAALVITGEGRIDGSTSAGKVPAGVLEAAKKQGIPVVAIAGSVSDSGLSTLYQGGLVAIFSICQGPISLSEAIRNGRNLIARTSEQIARIWLKSLLMKSRL